jgi:hypothetical protein
MKDLQLFVELIDGWNVDKFSNQSIFTFHSDFPVLNEDLELKSPLVINP